MIFYLYLKNTDPNVRPFANSFDAIVAALSLIPDAPERKAVLLDVEKE